MPSYLVIIDTVAIAHCKAIWEHFSFCIKFLLRLHKWFFAICWNNCKIFPEAIRQKFPANLSAFWRNKTRKNFRPTMGGNLFIYLFTYLLIYIDIQMAGNKLQLSRITATFSYTIHHEHFKLTTTWYFVGQFTGLVKQHKHRFPCSWIVMSSIASNANEQRNSLFLN